MAGTSQCIVHVTYSQLSAKYLSLSVESPFNAKCLKFCIKDVTALCLLQILSYFRHRDKNNLPSASSQTFPRFFLIQICQTSKMLHYCFVIVNTKMVNNFRTFGQHFLHIAMRTFCIAIIEFMVKSLE
jgi:hypothetical protein